MNEIEIKFIINIYCGGTYCGNGFFDDENKAIEWAKNDAFCDKAKIVNVETGEKKTIKFNK